MSKKPAKPKKNSPPAAAEPGEFVEESATRPADATAGATGEIREGTTVEASPAESRSETAADGMDYASDNPEDSAVAVRHRGANEYFRAMMDQNFLEYASYVVKDRAIPDVDDGLKPVQRRILWCLHKIDDGRTHKAANVIGNTMHYHPHGDASIGDAMVILANKEYFIHKQGNYGNILTGSPAAASRYIECSLSAMGREVLFNDDITEFVDSYDGRSQEPVVLPVKIPSLLMLGSDGIAVGMATKIMPHNFNELLQAQIAELRGESYHLYPDFQQGGLMDVRDYQDGNGKIVLRAKIDIEGKRLVIREIPATTTTESLIASIERAAEKNKIKISSVSDYTTEKVEIEIIPTRGYDPEKTRQALYMYTDCAVSISVNLTVIRESRPAVMSVTDVIKRNTSKLLEYLRRELEIDLARQEELFHAKTLAQIFFENRVYKRIEESKSVEEEYAEVHAGLAPFRDQLRRDVTDADVDKLLALPVRRISRFDIEKNQKEIAEILARMEEINKNLGSLKRFAIKYLQNLIDKYGSQYPRRTEIEHLEKIDKTAAALNNIKVGWDRRNGYIGTAIKSDDTISCNEFDRFVCVSKDGTYKIISLPPEKLFIGKLYDFRKYDANTEFGILYKETASGKYYGKRSSIGGYILDKEYQFCPAKCKLELLTPRPDAIYNLSETNARGSKIVVREINLMELPVRTPKARGLMVSSKNVTKITHSRYLTSEELAEFRSANPPEDSENDGNPPEETVIQAQEAERDIADSDGEMTKNSSAPKAPAAKRPAGPIAGKKRKTASEAPEEIGEELPVDSEEMPDELESRDELEKPKKSEHSGKDQTPETDQTREIEEETLVLSDQPEQEFASRQRKKPAAASKKGRAKKAGAVKPEPESVPPDDDDHPDQEDEFGIVQPEFGF